MRNVTLVLSSAMLTLVAFCSGPVHAQQQSCADRSTVLEQLSSKYGESRQSIGIGPKGQVVEMFASEETGSWTIIFTTPDGKTCMIASGQSYEYLGESLEPAGEDL